MITRLKPIVAKESYEERIERVISYALYQAIFKPILEVMGYKADAKGDIRKNAGKPGQSALELAIVSGQVVYDKGAFRGKFNGAISAEIRALGGKWDNAAKAYKLSAKGASVDARAMIVKATSKAKDDLEQINKILDLADISTEKINLVPFVDSIMEDLQVQFKKTVPPSLEIGMAMTGYIEDKIKSDYIDNMDLYIQNWKEEQIVRLREVVQENAAQGYRSTRLIEQIQAEYGVTKSKAKFLSRQETGLLVSKYRESTYKEAGIPAYMWSTSHDRRVRDSHKELNGRVFTWDNPPIVDPARGRRAHPGQDYGCRCVAVPVMARQLKEVA